MRTRPGFTLMELLAVFVLGIAIAAIAMPSMARNLAQIRVQRAATVVSADLRLAHSIAARQRAPVTVVVDTTNRIFRVRDTRTASTVFSERRMDRTSDYPIQRLSTNRTQLVVYPNGLASGDLNVTLTAAGRSRTVHMTRAGQVRVTAP